jgi:hypothetical protein
VEQPLQKVIEVLGADFAYRLANTQKLAQQTNVTGESFLRVGGKPFLFHVLFKRTEGCLQ